MAEPPDLDFLKELIDTPDYVPNLRKPALPPPGSPPREKVIGVLQYFPAISFNCNVWDNGVACKAPTRYLYMGNPACLSHALMLLELLQEKGSDPTQHEYTSRPKSNL